MDDKSPAPRALLSVPDGIFLVVGMVIGVGIFKAPSVVAGNTADATAFLGAWLLGGFISVCGALVYAELSARHPVTGGEYTFLSRGLGRPAAFLFAWSRMTVIQTGAIAAVAFVFGDYASEIVRLGEKSSAIYAAIGVVALTALNLAGTLQTKNLQKVMEITLISALVLLAIGGLVAGGTPKPAAPVPAEKLDFGLAMIFVLLTYGGWNEAAYIAGEVKDARRNMVRVLVVGLIGVTALYMLVNVGYLSALGLGGIRDSKAVGADLMRVVVGDKGAVALALIVCVSALTTMNAAIFTGARTNYALGQDFPAFAKLGTWRERGSTPANALVVQAVLSLVLILLSSFTPDGFSAMVAYTSPVFWTFFLLTGITLFVFRARDDANTARDHYRVPLHPVVPLVFCGMCAYMLYSSVNYIRFAVSFGHAVLAGIAVMALGIPLYFMLRHR